MLKIPKFTETVCFKQNHPTFYMTTRERAFMYTSLQTE